MDLPPPLKFVKAVPVLKAHLEALMILTEDPKPPLMPVRSKEIVVACYGMGDASGGGFGGAVEAPPPHRKFTAPAETGTPGVRIRVGVWGSDAQGNSSNYRELQNLVEMVEAEWKAGRMQGVELFLCTDNQVSESCYYYATSTSEELFGLVVRLKMLELRGGLKIHILWVAGTRQIASGIDGLSRGNLSEGVMQGAPLCNFLELADPTHLRSHALLPWVQSWTRMPGLRPLTPEEWFVKGHGIAGGSKDPNGVWIPFHRKGTFLWIRPPAAADVALEEIGRAKHKRAENYHIFICPRHMMPLWRRLLYKNCDFVCIIPAGPSFWPSHMHEPLILGIVLPLIPHRPWELRGTPKLLGMGRKMSKPKMWEAGEEHGGRILRQLLSLPRELARMPQRLVWQVLHGRPGK